MSRSATRTSLLWAQVALAQPNKAEDDSAALVEQGRAALKKHDLDHAAIALDQAIALNPRRVEAYVLRSAVFAARKQYRDGIALMRRAQALAPADLEVENALGTQLVLAGDAAPGIALLEQVVAKAPERYDADLLLGRTYHDAGKWPEAIHALEAYFAHRPVALAGEDGAHHVELADAYLRARDPRTALPMFEQAVRESPGDARARIGAAWATAAIDCRKARPLLERLASLAEQYPEIALVDGQCALALGDTATALARGTTYLERGNSAAGHALVGEARAAKGELAGAIDELGKARALEPGRRRWPVRLALVLRTSGKPADGLAQLEQIGPPSAPAADPEWWIELGESLLATDQASACVTRLAPAVAELATDATVHVVYGQALLAVGRPADAAAALELADKLQPSPRGGKLLAQALVAVAEDAIGRNDIAPALQMLERAVSFDPTAKALRDLGIADLAGDRARDAVTALDRAIQLEPTSVALMLDARAHAIAGDVAAARPLYERAMADKLYAVDAAIDWAASELAGGDPAIAVSVLDRVAVAGKGGQRYRAAVVDARHAAGLAALKAGNAARAVELLRTAGDSLATRCDLAVATVALGDASAALGALKAIGGQSCPFPPPADTQAAPILAAFVDGLAPAHASRALDRLQALKATGAAAALQATAIRVVALAAAQQAYNADQLAQARKYLAAAKAANTATGADELAVDLALLDLADGNLDGAIAQLERSHLPDALVSLGIAYEKKGEQSKAVDAWRRAKKAGVKLPALDAWIEAKVRVYGD